MRKVRELKEGKRKSENRNQIMLGKGTGSKERKGIEGRIERIREAKGRGRSGTKQMREGT